MSSSDSESIQYLLQGLEGDEDRPSNRYAKLWGVVASVARTRKPQKNL